MGWFQIGMLLKTVWFRLDIRPTKLNRKDRDAQRKSNSRPYPIRNTMLM